MPVVRRTFDAVSVETKETIRQTCSECGGAWDCDFTVRYTEKRERNTFSGPADDATIQTMTLQAQSKLPKIVTLARSQIPVDSFNVICPECEHFSESVVSRWFPNGYQNGVLALLRRQLPVPLYYLTFCVVALAILTVFMTWPSLALFSPKPYADFLRQSPRLSWGLISVASVLTVGALASVVIFLQRLCVHKRVIAYWGSKKEDDVLQWLVEACRFPGRKELGSENGLFSYWYSNAFESHRVGPHLRKAALRKE